MKKSILNLAGAQELSRNEQKNITGSTIQPNPNTGYVNTLSGSAGSIVNLCDGIDDCPMQLNYDGSVKTPECKSTVYGTRCFYSYH